MSIRTKLGILSGRPTSTGKANLLGTLKDLSQAEATELLTSIKELVYHYDPEIRVAALNCLKQVEQAKLTEIIQDNIRDPNPDVRYAALVLFHLND